MEFGVGQVPPGKRGRSYLRKSPDNAAQDPKRPKKTQREYLLPTRSSLEHPNVGHVIGRDRRERFRLCIILGWLIAVIGVDPVCRSDLLSRLFVIGYEKICHSRGQMEHSELISGLGKPMERTELFQTGTKPPKPRDLRLCQLPRDFEAELNQFRSGCTVKGLTGEVIPRHSRSSVHRLTLNYTENGDSQDNHRLQAFAGT